MSNNEELDPEIVRALKDVPPGSAFLRDAHIAAALSEVSVPKKHPGVRLRIVGGVAAAFLFALGGVAVLRDGAEAPQMATEPTDASIVIKGSALCKDVFSQLPQKISYSESVSNNNQDYVLMFRENGIDMYYAESPCSLVEAIEYSSALNSRDNETQTAPTATCTESVIHTFSAAGEQDNYSLVVIQTESGISVRFADRCGADIATLSFPALP